MRLINNVGLKHHPFIFLGLMGMLSKYYSPGVPSGPLVHQATHGWAEWKIQTVVRFQSELIGTDLSLLAFHWGVLARGLSSRGFIPSAELRPRPCCALYPAPQEALWREAEARGLYEHTSAARADSAKG